MCQPTSCWIPPQIPKGNKKERENDTHLTQIYTKAACYSRLNNKQLSSYVMLIYSKNYFSKVFKCICSLTKKDGHMSALLCHQFGLILEVSFIKSGYSCSQLCQIFWTSSSSSMASISFSICLIWSSLSSFW